MYWKAVGLAGGSLIVGVAILVDVWPLLRSIARAERVGEERLGMLRERQERLPFLRKELRMLGEELGWRRPMMDREQQVPELKAPLRSAKLLRSDGQPEAEHTGPRSWWRRIPGGRVRAHHNDPERGLVGSRRGRPLRTLTSFGV